MESIERTVPFDAKDIEKEMKHVLTSLGHDGQHRIAFGDADFFQVSSERYRFST